MACRELIRERERNDKWNRLLDELYMYNILVAKWGLGHIRLRLVKKYVAPGQGPFHHLNPLTFYTEVYGHYVDLQGRKDSVFLGNSFDQAAGRLDHVKSFL